MMQKEVCEIGKKVEEGAENRGAFLGWKGERLGDAMCDTHIAGEGWRRRGIGSDCSLEDCDCGEC